MSYEQDKIVISRLIQDMKPVPGTYPPVYLFDDALVIYDKRDRFKIVAARTRPAGPQGWKDKVFKSLLQVLIGQNFRRLMEYQSHVDEPESWDADTHNKSWLQAYKEPLQ